MPAYLVPLLILGVSAGLSNFGGAIGLGILPLRARQRLEIVGAFVGMEVLMPVIGIAIGDRMAGGLGRAANAIAALVLVAIGVYTLVETRREARDLSIPLRRRALALLAFALSLDNLAIGFSLGLIHAPLAVAASFMGACSGALTLVGLELGRQLGRRVGDRSELFSGLVLIAAGVFVLVHG